LLCSRGLADWGKSVWLERDRAEDHSEGIAVCILGAVVGQCLRHNCAVRKEGRDEHRSLIPTDSEVVKGVGIDWAR